MITLITSACGSMYDFPTPTTIETPKPTWFPDGCIDANLKPYIEDFINDAADFDLVIDINKITAYFNDFNKKPEDNNILGRCNKTLGAIPEIIIDSAN